jgi:ribonuclease-3
MKQVKKIVKSIKETKSFQQAFTHTSYLNENNLEFSASYETLEFLGDSILNFYVSLFIYRSFPDYSEGQMSKLKQLMVQEVTLAYLSKEIGFGEFLQLGTGEKKNQGDSKSSILADIFESFVAALYLEKGGKTVWRFLSLTLFSWSKGKENMIWDYKSQLQEYCQARKIKLYYNLKAERRADHQQIFVVEAVLENKIIDGKKKGNEKLETIREGGEGGSKKEAEQQAASKVIKRLGTDKE